MFRSKKIFHFLLSAVISLHASDILAQTKILLLGNSITNGVLGSTDSLGFRNDLYTILTNSSMNFDFVGSSGTDPYEGHFLDGTLVRDFYSGGFGNGTFDVAGDMNSFAPEWVLIHIGTNDVGNNNSVVAPFSDDGGQTFKNTVAGRIGELIQYLIQWKNGTYGTSLKKIYLCQIIPKAGAETAIVDLNTELTNLVTAIDAGNVPGIPPGNVTLVDQHSTFNSATMRSNDGIHPNDTGYNNMAIVYANSLIGNLTVVDDFNRTSLGNSWAANAEFVITNNELDNSATDQSWNHMAVYKSLVNPSEVSFKWGATAAAQGIANGGLALMLDAPSTSANGYLIWHNGTFLDLWTIVNGAPGAPVQRIAAQLAAPVAGDVFNVVMTSDATGHHFSAYINGQLDGTISDDQKLQGNATTLYAGVMINGTTEDNSIDDFTLKNATAPPPDDVTAPGQITDLRVFSTSATSISLAWTAPGDDNDQGTAKSYVIRYSTQPITDANFNSASLVPNPPAPQVAGTNQTVTISSLAINSQYYFAMKTLDEVLNASALSNVVSGSTGSGTIVTDNFNRTAIGPDWAYDPEYSISGNELACSATNWGSMAVYKARRNPIEVGFKWGANATTAGIQTGGVALMLDGTTPNANGYLVWHNDTFLELYTIVNGAPGVSVDRVASLLSAPQAGDVFKVVPSTDASGHVFKCYINDVFDGSLTDAGMVQGNGTNLYAGVMLAGGSTITNVDDFFEVVQTGAASAIEYVSGNGQIDTVNTILENPFVAKVTDQNGNPIANVSVQFNVVSGNGVLGTPPAPDSNIRIEAEEGNISAPFLISNDPLAAGGKYIEVPLPNPGGVQGVATYTFNVPSDGNYVIWGRCIAPSGTEDSFFLKVDGGSEKLWEPFQGDWKTTWQWDLVSDRGSGYTATPEFDPVYFNLTAGTHTLEIKSRDENTKLDKLLITSDLNYQPSGLEEVDGWMSDANGLVKATYTLGPAVGENRVQATSTGLTGSPVEFTATGVADTAAKLVEVSGNGQPAGEGGQPLANPFIVAVTDNFGNPVSGIPVTFTVTVGNGTLSNTQPVLTDANGQASTTLTLGTLGPLNEVRASSPGLTPAEIVFTATASTGVATDIKYVSGNNQTGTVGTQLANTIAVKVVDSSDQPQANFDVTFAVTQGGGSIVETQPVKTDANGVAQVHWKLGNIAGINKAQAQTPGLNGSPVTFTATGTADVAVKMEKVDGDSAAGKVNQQLANPFRVKVLDQYNNPVKNVGILFTVTEGGGKFINNQVTQTVNTDSSGIAATFLILGPVAGNFNNKVTAAKSGLTGSPVTFVASASASSAAKMVYVSGNNQLGFVRQALPQPFKVKVMDASDNVIAGHPVEFSVQSGGGTLNGDTKTTETVTTDAQGFASITFWPGPVAGNLNNVVNASSTNGQTPLTNSPIVFKASAKYTATKIQLVEGNSQSGVVGSELPTVLKVKVLDVSDQPVANVPVTFEIKAGGGKLDTDKTTVTKNTDAQGSASVRLTLGPTVGADNNVVHASASDGFDPLTNSPIIFKASAVASNAIKIVSVDGNNQTGVVGKPLTKKIKVSVQDNNGNGVSGHPVQFAVTKGGGHFTGGDTVKAINSNATGIAEIVWTLGTLVGTNNNQLKVEADDGVNPLQNSPLTFKASAVADVTDPDVSTVTATSPAVADGNSVSNIIVTLLDKFNNPISGKTVTAAVSGSKNFLIPPTAVTGTDGKASFSLTSITAETKTIVATNSTDNIQINNTAMVKFNSGPAARIEVASGNEQTRNVGTVLKDPLAVRVSDNFNNPVQGTAVFFEVQDGKSGGKIVENQPVVSDENGLAKVSYILGNDTGSNLIKAQSGSLGSLLFLAYGETGTASQIVKVSGDSQNGIAGQPLADNIVVRVLDQKNDPVKDVTVNFSVTLGGGQVSPLQASTDAYGNASTAFTLGPNIGVHIVKAEAPGLQNSPLSFIANASSGVAEKVVLVSGDNQNGVVNTFAAPLRVKVIDANDNAVADFPVQFKVISGDVTITNAQPDSSDEGGFASAIAKFGTKAGDVVIQAVANGLTGSPIEFNLTALPDVATSVQLAWGNNQRGTVGHELINSLAVKVKDQFNNNVPGFAVQFVITQGDASIIGNSLVESNAAGNAFCRIMLGSTPGTINVLAIASGLNGSPVPFVITAVQNNFPTLNVDIIDATIEETQAISFNMTGNDPDSDPLTFQVWNLPAGAKFDSLNTTTRKFEWTPDYTQSGNYEIRFGLTDGNGGIDVDTVKINVLNKNRKPTITAYLPDNNGFKIEAGSGQQFSIEAADPDQEQIEYFWTLNGQKVAKGQTYYYSSDPNFLGRDIVIGYASDSFDTVSHKWTITVTTSVELESFTAIPSTNSVGVELKWITRRENDNQGFNIYRSLIKEGDYEKINQNLIPPEKSGNYSYFDDQIQAGLRYYYKLEDVSITGKTRMHGPVLAEAALPQTFSLEQNYPNPFGVSQSLRGNPETTIKFQLPRHAHVYLGVFNLLGQQVRVLVDKEVAAGFHTLKWDGKDENGEPVTSGIYYYRIKTENYTALKKMILLK